MRADVHPLLVRVVLGLASIAGYVCAGVVAHGDDHTGFRDEYLVNIGVVDGAVYAILLIKPGQTGVFWSPCLAAVIGSKHPEFGAGIGVHGIVADSKAVHAVRHAGRAPGVTVIVGDVESGPVGGVEAFAVAFKQRRINVGQELPVGAGARRS